MAASLRFEAAGKFLGLTLRHRLDLTSASNSHTPFAGSANREKGVTIDLQSLNQVNLAQDKKTVSIGAGSRWIDVYQKLDALSLATSGGRSAAVGVGGLTLGGKGSHFHA